MGKRQARRDFVKGSALAATGFWIANSTKGFAQSDSPNEKLNFACIGVGGKGDSDTDDAARFGNIVGICDVDENQLDKKGKKYPEAKKYFDFRKMLEDLGDKIDAVTVSTPDHTHAVAAAMAMRMGKAAYVQKPLTWSIHEAAVLRQIAAEKNLATQMGNQGTAHDGFRTGIEVLRSGALGTIKEIHCWTNRPIWPQGIRRPVEPMPVPNHLHWYEFLGPAPDRGYHSAYAPFRWRGWLDYGTGALGDMACHTLNIAFHALELIDPEWVDVVDTSGIVDDASYPQWSVIQYQFGPRGNRGPIKMTWYDGGTRLPADKQVPESLLHGQDRSGSGLLIVGDKGSFFSKNDYGSEHILLPADKFVDYKRPEPVLPRVGGDHFGEFVTAIKGGPKSMSNFDAAGKLTETVLLGVVALRTGKRIEWDPVNLRAKNVPAADEFITREYRKGWYL